MSIFGLFFPFWTTLDPPCGRVNILADGNLLATYLKIGLDYEFDVKTAKFNYTSFQNVRFSQKLTHNTLFAIRTSILHYNFQNFN
jgi:hypothetical protein